GVRRHLAERRPVGAPVRGVVVGALRVVDLVLPAALPPLPPMPPMQPIPPSGPAAPPAAGVPPPPRPQVQASLEFEANMTVGAPGADHTQYVRERWRLVRDAGVLSKPPSLVRTFNCPNCGAPFEPGEGSQGDRCSYCDEVVSGGRFDWTVQQI